MAFVPWVPGEMKRRARRAALADGGRHRLVGIPDIVLRDVHVVGVLNQDALAGSMFRNASFDSHLVYSADIDGVVQIGGIEHSRAPFTA